MASLFLWQVLHQEEEPSDTNQMRHNSRQRYDNVHVNLPPFVFTGITQHENESQFGWVVPHWYWRPFFWTTVWLNPIHGICIHNDDDIDDDNTNDDEVFLKANFNDKNIPGS